MSMLMGLFRCPRRVIIRRCRACADEKRTTNKTRKFQNEHEVVCIGPGREREQTQIRTHHGKGQANQSYYS